MLLGLHLVQLHSLFVTTANNSNLNMEITFKTNLVFLYTKCDGHTTMILSRILYVKLECTT